MKGLKIFLIKRVVLIFMGLISILYHILCIFECFLNVCIPSYNYHLKLENLLFLSMDLTEKIKNKYQIDVREDFS